eukprot:jgi/Astpho2/4914/fgenesh1_pg.00069_%23_46_t
MQQEAVTVPEAISTPEHGIEGHVQAQGVVESSFQKLRRSWMNLLASQLACSSVSRLGEQAWLLLSIAIDQGLTPDMQQEAANIPETIKTSGSDEDGDVQAQRVVESSFQKLRPSWMNLLDDLGSIDHFIIEGDALLLDLLSSARLDFAHGGQFLQLIWGLEQIIARLAACQNAHFKVVFFEQQRTLWQHEPSLLLARDLAEHHLRSVLHVEVLSMDSWWSPEWRQYLAEAAPVFILLTDLPGPQAEQQLSTAQKLMQAASLFHLSHHTAGHITQVAFLPELHFQQDVVFGFRCSRLVASRTHIGPSAGTLQAAQTAGIEACAQLGGAPTETAMALQLCDAETLQGTGLTPLWRTRAGTAVCAALVGQAAPCDPKHLPVLVYAWCLHEALLQTLALPQRALTLPESVAEPAPLLAALPGFLQAVCSGLHQLLAGSPPSPSSPNPTSDPAGHDLASCADLLDGRIMHILVHSLSAHQALGLPEQVAQAASGLLAAVFSLAGRGVPTSDPLLEAAEQCAAAPVPEAEALGSGSHPEGRANGHAGLPDPVMGHGLVQAFLGSCNTDETDDEDADCNTVESLEPAFLVLTEDDKADMQKWMEAPLIDVAKGCRYLRPFQRRKVQQLLTSLEASVFKPSEAQDRQREMRQQVREWIQQFQERINQLQSRHLHNYADTLSQQVFSSSAQKGATSGGSRQPQPGRGKAAKPVKLSKAEQIKADNTARKQDKGANQQVGRWDVKRKEFESEISRNGWTPAAQARADAFLRECEGAPGKRWATYVAAAVALFSLQHSVAAWKTSCLKQKGEQSAEANGRETPDATVDLLKQSGWRQLRGSAEHAQAIWYTVLYSRQQGLLASSRELLAEAVKALQLLGFQQAVEQTSAEAAAAVGGEPKPGKKTSSKKGSGSSSFSSSHGSKQYAAGMTEVEFQLAHCGHLLQRDAPPDRDPRAKSFNPDYWQREVLDVVDSSSSAIVVAPTSSGKTFISDYVCNHVMQHGGRVVFVAPTKALVNQQHAQAARNFGTDRAGVFTRDFRIHALDARILITVPACLEILLLSPRHQEWARSVRYVIFDEVHCMREGGIKEGGTTEATGVLWEHCLGLIRCPFLALSATIGNPEALQGWLQSLKSLQQKQDRVAGTAAKGSVYDVRLIVHRERYADLRHYMVNTGALDPWRSQNDPLQASDVQNMKGGPQQVEAALRKLHPCAVLMLEQLSGNFPSEVTFEPADSLQLHATMQAVVAASSQGSEAVIGPRTAVQHMLPLLRLLDEQNLLPALAFQFDRAGCMALTEAIVEELEGLQQQKRDNPDYQDQVRKRQSTAEQQQRAAKQQRDKKVQRRDAESMQDDQDVLGYEVEQEIDPEFSFAGRSATKRQSDIDEDIERALQNHCDESDVLWRGLKRGIGVHHSGLPTPYRQLVEVLFRAKYLRVVFATGTLSYGINMPCRTVVFVGDHVWLNSLQYRQMAGRAGRRGFDQLGHVAFLEVPFQKVRSLQVSPVPYLIGNFPLTVTLSLRLLMLTGADPLDIARQHDAMRVLSCPFYAHRDPDLVQKMQHLFRYSLRLLQREGLLTQNATPQGLSAFASHLFWTEPSNLVVSRLVHAGTLQRICAPMSKVPEAELYKPGGIAVWDRVASRLLHVLAYLFERLPLRSAGMAALKPAGSLSKVILDPLPSDIASLLAQHNEEAFDMFGAGLAEHAASMAEDSGSELPMSHLTFSLAPQPCGRLGLSPDPAAISSPFACLSGVGDTFQSTAELVHVARPGLLVDASAVPLLREVDRYGHSLPLNAFIVDYWSHSNKHELSDANGLHQNTAWEHLKGFSTILKVLNNGLKRSTSGDPLVLSCMERLATEFDVKFKNFNTVKGQQWLA